MRNDLSRRSWKQGALALLLLAALPWSPARAQDAPAIRDVVLDIISFTRWPQPHAELRLCIVGSTTNAAAFFAQPLRVGPTLVSPRRTSLSDEQVGDACDILYEGLVSTPDREQLMHRIAGHPILTIGEAVPGCIELTMFCLSRNAQASFSANLDAIARSGVRLNPRVLLLGRRGFLGQ